MLNLLRLGTAFRKILHRAQNTELALFRMTVAIPVCETKLVHKRLQSEQCHPLPYIHHIELQS